MAAAVAAPAAFPPALSPVTLKLEDAAFTLRMGKDLQRAAFTICVILTNGGVYDNLGLETAWKRCRRILISDAGGNLKPEEKPKGDRIRHTLRNLFIIDNQVGSLRRCNIMDAYRVKNRLGAFWSIRTDLQNYRLPRYSLDCQFEKTIGQRTLPRDLRRCHPARRSV